MQEVTWLILGHKSKQLKPTLNPGCWLPGAFAVAFRPCLERIWNKSHNIQRVKFGFHSGFSPLGKKKSCDFFQCSQHHGYSLLNNLQPKWPSQENQRPDPDTSRNLREACILGPHRNAMKYITLEKDRTEAASFWLPNAMSNLEKAKISQNSS